MITCKEDLIDTYIVNDCKVKRDKLVEVCRSFEIYPFSSDTLRHHWHTHLIIDKEHILGADKVNIDNRGDSIKQLHLSDLFPEKLVNTKVHSTDEEVVRLYAELCENEVKTHHDNARGYSNGKYLICSFEHKSNTYLDPSITTISEKDVRALHREKFAEQYGDNNMSDTTGGNRPPRKPPVPESSHNHTVLNEAAGTTAATKPPLGLRPKHFFDEELKTSVDKRIEEIVSAMQRYVEVGKSIPVEWVEELTERVQQQNCVKGDTL